MATTVVGLFDQDSDAKKVQQELMRHHFEQQDISLYASKNTAGLDQTLLGAGVPEEDTAYYIEGVRRGGTLVMVHCHDDLAMQAHEIMTKFGAVDINARGAEWQKSGWQQVKSTQAKPMASKSQSTTARTQVNQGNEMVLPVTEEELQVGKRQVQSGGVRVYTRMTEKPAEAQVTLRDETVKVERHAVNRPVTEADMQASKQGVIEMTETDEEAVVSKQARVVEEVVVGKETQERTQTVRDTVRRTDVEVEKLDGSDSTTTSSTTTSQRPPKKKK